ncbi:SWR1-complex protein 4 [Diplocarpon rosae]|nr:SWR1-complex protein 4 [Diplocarpon rosae]
MTSHDVRDMLDLPGEAGPRPAKKQKLSAPRPVLKGLAREVQNLGGDNPIAIVPEVISFKKKRFGSRKPAVKWDLKAFKNSARDGDNLVLRHWRKRDEAPPTVVAEDGSAVPPLEPQIEDSMFAKFNVKVNTPQYTDEQYKQNLQSQDWSKHETDYLLAIVQEFDLRWPVIWDRYDYQPPAPQMEAESAEVAMVSPPKVRTMEDMKHRYYVVAATMMKINTKVEVMNHAEFDLLERMQKFDPIKEMDRKKFAEAAFSRTKEEAIEEESLLLELKRILARSEKLGDERRELYHLLEAPASTSNVSMYSSSQNLHGLFQQLMNVDKTKKRKSIMDAGTSPAPGSINQNSQTNIDRRESSVRESLSGPSGGGAPNNKKGPAQAPERRQLTPEEEKLYGVKRFDRITTSGPNFRSDRIKKPITSKSQTQQLKINNVLNELGVTSTLFMPTAEVGEFFDALLTGVNLLLDQRKHLDKLQGELNTALNIKAERERRERAERGGEPDPEELKTENAEGHKESEPSVKVDQSTREKSAAASMMGTSATANQHKRSASELSTVSDNTSKRQKK